MVPELIEDLGMQYPTKNSKQKVRYGLFKCMYCGATFKTRISSVKSGNTTSCGCYHKQVVSENRKTHGLSEHLIYDVWTQMVQRCGNPNNKSYNNYGGRGIVVCNEWAIFQTFHVWAMQNGYQEGLSLDRINVDGDYTPSNCRWTTISIQNKNTQVLRKDNTSGYRGACFHTTINKWIAQISVDGKRKHLGIFESALDAAKAYDQYVIDNNYAHTINGVVQRGPK